MKTKEYNRHVNRDHLEVNENQIKEIVIACYCCYFFKVKVLEQKLAKFARSAKQRLCTVFYNMNEFEIARSASVCSNRV